MLDILEGVEGCCVAAATAVVIACFAGQSILDLLVDYRRMGSQLGDRAFLCAVYQEIC